MFLSSTRLGGRRATFRGMAFGMMQLLTDTSVQAAKIFCHIAAISRPFGKDPKTTK